MISERVPPIRAVVLDLDGILLRDDKSVSARTRVALQRCAEAGILLVLATARPPRATQLVLRDVPWFAYAVPYNGTLIIGRTRPLERHLPIPWETGQRLTAWIATRAPTSHVSYEVKDTWYVTTDDGAAWADGSRLGAYAPQPVQVDARMLEGVHPTKILVRDYPAWPELAEAFRDTVHVLATDGGTLVQIMHRDASKEAAVAGILEAEGVAPRAVLVCGDDANDLGLFQLCGFPVAMANAIPALKARAAVITASNNDDGVARVLEQFVLTG